MTLSFLITLHNPLRIHSVLGLQWSIVCLVLLIWNDTCHAEEVLLYDRDRIALEPAIVNFGSIRSSSISKTLTKDIQIRNHSDEVVEIKQVKPSCGCTKPHIESTLIPPRGTTTLIVGLDLTGIQGERATNVALVYADKSVSVLPIIVTVVDVIQFSADLIQGKFPIEGRDKVQFSFSRVISSKLENNLTAACSSQFLECTVSSTEFLKQSDSDTKVNLFVATASIDVSKLAVGRHEGSIQVVFSDGVSSSVPYSFEVLPLLNVQRVIPAIISGKSKPSSVKLLVCHSPLISNFCTIRLGNQECEITQVKRIDSMNSVVDVSIENIKIKNQGYYIIDGAVGAMGHGRSIIRSAFQIAVTD